jgi:hypothetical protein
MLSSESLKLVQTRGGLYSLVSEAITQLLAHLGPVDIPGCILWCWGLTLAHCALGFCIAVLSDHRRANPILNLFVEP